MRQSNLEAAFLRKRWELVHMVESNGLLVLPQ